MQVVQISVPPVRAANAGKAFSPVSGIITYLANSTRLTRAEKESFMRQLAQLEKAGAITAKILKQIMMAIQFAESAREEGRFAQQLPEDLMQRYHEIMGKSDTVASDRHEALVV